MGFTIDDRVRWNRHVEELSPKCYAVIAALRKLRDAGVLFAGLRLAYQALLTPVLTYGIAVWGGGYMAPMTRAQVILNDGVRLEGRHFRLSDCFF